MNNQEAKLILQAYHPGGRDASDPLFAEALEQARRDPELQKWFADEQALDSRIQSKLRTAVLVPRDLKSNLLALRKINRPVPWWFQPMKLAAAAAVVSADWPGRLFMAAAKTGATGFVPRKNGPLLDATARTHYL